MCDVVFIEEVKPFADVCKNAQFGTKEPRLLNGNDTRYCSPRYRITLVQPIPGLEVKEGDLIVFAKDNGNIILKSLQITTIKK